MSWAKVIAHSINPMNQEIATLALRYPRIIHSEFMTHRVFSRNASSSRAIPTLILIRQVFTDMAYPVSFGANQRGMQAGAELTGWHLAAVKAIWTLTGWLVACMAYLAYLCGVHKQVVNRMIEPWTWISVVVTATDWDNFFELRRHRDADPTIRKLADDMYWALKTSTPTPLYWGEWHVPYVSLDELHQYGPKNAVQMSSARCARVSYLTHEGRQPTLDQDRNLYTRLVGSNPIHASPTEHQAKATMANEPSNLSGCWHQHRKDVEKEMKAA